jgi:hypothetical protein
MRRNRLIEAVKETANCMDQETREGLRRDHFTIEV